MMEGLHQLPELPDGIRTLKDVESDWLRSFDANVVSSVRHCKTCGGKRTFKWRVREGDGWKQVMFECPCEEQLVLHRYLAFSGIELAYQRLGWDDLVGCDPQAVATVNAWLDNADANIRAGVGLLLRGGFGTGKTLLSQLAFKRLLAEGFEGWSVPFHRMVSTLMDSWSSPQAQRDFYSRCMNAPILVMDDLGQEAKRRFAAKEGERKVSSSTAEFAIDMILRHRGAAALPTIITTNFTVDQIAQHYGPNIKSLLTGSFRDCPFGGTDFRPFAGAERVEEAAQGLTRPLVIG